MKRGTCENGNGEFVRGEVHLFYFDRGINQRWKVACQRKWRGFLLRRGKTFIKEKRGHESKWKRAKISEVKRGISRRTWKDVLTRDEKRGKGQLFEKKRRHLSYVKKGIFAQTFLISLSDFSAFIESKLFF